MEPGTIKILTTLFAVGIHGWEALREKGFDTPELEIAKELFAAGGEAAIGRRGQPVVYGTASAQLAMIVAAFGRAFDRHWVGTRSFRPARGLRRFFDRFDRDRQTWQKELETRFALAQLMPASVGDRAAGIAELTTVDALTASPLGTPYYRELWRVFSDSALLLDGEDPPLDITHETRQAFETHFLLAYCELRTGPAGRAVNEYLVGMEEHRTRVVRHLLVADMAGWGDRHVFGNVARRDWDQDQQQLPFLPLGRMYVEPDARRDDDSKDVRRPILGCLDELLGETCKPPYIAVVKADFGSGKSLTARTLACRLAERYLGTVGISVDAWLPVFIRCADDFSDSGFNLDETVRRALKRQADGLGGISLADNDPAFTLPERDQRVLYILDGLDEIALGQRRLQGMFQQLRGRQTSKHRFIVFSRPGVLPDHNELRDIPVLDLLPFRTMDMHDEPGGQVQIWLDAWNRETCRSEPLTAAALAERELLSLAQTPILLFMVAHTWDSHAAAVTAPSQASLYEAFFQDVARGKHRMDREQHTLIAEAAEKLRERLCERGDLDRSAQPHQAMLWLMSRMAWEERRLARRGEPLTRRIVANLVHDELKLGTEVADTVEVGLLLNMQADLRAGNDQILFGHKSFREFLVARYWADRLATIANARERDWPKLTEALHGARLLGQDDRSFEFLMEIINAPMDTSSAWPFGWSREQHRKLVEWAEEYFNDDQQVFPGSSQRSLDDQSAMLREAALAIGCSVQGSPGIKARDPHTLRSMLAWLWLRGEPSIVIAPKADLRESRLRRADLTLAHLAGADLARADLAHVYLVGADLTGANLARADLARANLARASLARADLSHASLARARLAHASFADADLSHADLTSALLVRANLVGAILDHADLAGAIFVGATYDSSTRWPAGFDPIAVDAINIDAGDRGDTAHAAMSAEVTTGPDAGD